MLKIVRFQLVVEVATIQASRKVKNSLHVNIMEGKIILTSNTRESRIWDGENDKNLGMLRSFARIKDNNNKEKLKFQIKMRKNNNLLHHVLHLDFKWKLAYW